MIRSSRDNGGWRAQRENDRRKERGIWAGHSKRIVGPPDSGSAHRRIAGLYRVPTLDPSRSLRRPRISFPPPLPHPSHLPAGRKNSAAPKRTFSSALVSAGWRAQRENDRRKERGILAGHSKKNCGAPPDSGSAHRRIAGLYRVPTLKPRRSLPGPRISFPPPLPHPSHLPAGRKNSAAHRKTVGYAHGSGRWRA